MGWNNWDCFAGDVHENQVIDVADYIAEHLKDFGWEMQKNNYMDNTR